MKLINLRLLDEPHAICIEAGQEVWDIHSDFTLESVHQSIRERSVTLSWKSTAHLLPAICTFSLIFTEVDYFEVTPRDPEIPDFQEDACLDGLSRVSAKSDSRSLMFQGVPCFLEEPFHLWFVLRGGQYVRIGAETVVFHRNIITP